MLLHVLSDQLEGVRLETLDVVAVVPLLRTDRRHTQLDAELAPADAADVQCLRNEPFHVTVDGVADDRGSDRIGGLETEVELDPLFGAAEPVTRDLGVHGAEAGHVDVREVRHCIPPGGWSSVSVVLGQLKF